MAIAKTSMDSHRENLRNGIYQPKERMILSALRDKGTATSRELAESLGMETASVSARVNLLVEAEKIERFAGGKNISTGKSAYILKIKEQEGL